MGVAVAWVGRTIAVLRVTTSCMNIPKSTFRGWINGEFRTAVGTESVTRTEIDATKILALSSVLKVVGLSQSRYHAWRRFDTQDLPSQLANARRAAREARVTVNKATSCETCRGSPASSAVLKEAA